MRMSRLLGLLGRGEFDPEFDLQISGTKGTDWNILMDSNGDWIVYMFNPVNITLTKPVAIDAFCVGGGGGGMGYWSSKIDDNYRYPGGGGGGGRCATVKNLTLDNGIYLCTVGAGGVGGYNDTGVVQKSSTSGGASSIVKGEITYIKANGGTRSAGHTGGAGGSGGGGGGHVKSDNANAGGGAGGSNGAKGATSKYAGGTGEGQSVRIYAADGSYQDSTLSNTRAFAETALTGNAYDGGGFYYASGGGGGKAHGIGNSASPGKSYYFTKFNPLTLSTSTIATPSKMQNTGTGGGGIANDYPGGDGTKGLIIIRNAR